MGVTINWGSDIKLLIPYGFLEYIFNFNPEEAWQTRGISGYKGVEYDKLLQKRLGKIKGEINEVDIQEKLREFIEESLTLFKALINNKLETTENYLGSKEFYFIVGPPRTGGTYVLKEVSRAFDWPREELGKAIIHDSVPQSKIITGNNLTWKVPQNYYNIVFQLAQLLVYIKRKAGGKKKVVIKNSYCCFCLPLLDNFFGNQAHYIVTVRHPGAMIASKASAGTRGRNIIIKDYEKFKEGYFQIWQDYYHALVENAPPKGEFISLLYGPEMDMFLEELFMEYNPDKSPEGVRITPRKYNYEYWNQESILDKMEKIEKLWSVYDLEFPIPKQIL